MHKCSHCGYRDTSSYYSVRKVVIHPLSEPPVPGGRSASRGGDRENLSRDRLTFLPFRGNELAAVARVIDVISFLSRQNIATFLAKISSTLGNLFPRVSAERRKYFLPLYFLAHRLQKQNTSGFHPRKPDRARVNV